METQNLLVIEYDFDLGSDEYVLVLKQSLWMKWGKVKT